MNPNEKTAPVPPIEPSAPAGPPAEVRSSYPAPVIDPTRAELGQFVKPTPSVGVPAEHASIPPVATLGSSTVTLPPDIHSEDRLRELEKEGATSGRGEAVMTDRQLKIFRLKGLKTSSV